ncbi:MAG TPA: leucine-rich repeat domain-containing protein [Polyangiaceae bacterium]|jgi:internalin A|nr:leucine-rich repeat domain-containing protein [Polyangiaceae bacterium]
MSTFHRSLCVFGLGLLLAACEDPPKPDAAASAATAASAAPSATPAPSAATLAPEAEKPPPPKVTKKLEDCPKGPNVTFDQKEIEDEVRKKLQKPDGALTSADLKKVKSLNLSQVKMAGLDVCIFSQLTGLKDLFLGPGDYDDLSPIAGAKELESLAASRNQIKDLTPLAKFSKLDRLDLGRTQVSDLRPIAGLTSLTEIALDDCPVEDISPLAKMTKLEKLSIQRTKVKDASPLKAIKGLKFLYVAGTPADEDGITLAPVRGNGTKVFN